LFLPIKAKFLYLSILVLIYCYIKTYKYNYEKFSWYIFRAKTDSDRVYKFCCWNYKYSRVTRQKITISLRQYVVAISYPSFRRI